MPFCVFPLHLRMVTFSNNVEPANGFLVRYLHRKMMESEDEKNLTNEDLIRVLDWVPKLWYHLHAFLEKHSTSDFLIGMIHTLLRTGHEESCIFILLATSTSLFVQCVPFDVLFSPLPSPQAPASSYPVPSQWMSFDPGSSTFGITLLSLTCKRGPRTASRWETEPTSPERLQLAFHVLPAKFWWLPLSREMLHS